MVQEYVGTIRWRPSVKLPQLDRSSTPGVLQSWNSFFNTRLGGTRFCQDGKLTIVPELVDGLSFPLSFLWCVRRSIELQVLPKWWLTTSHVRIIAAGCTHRLEQRILQETNYFNELTSYFPHSHLQLCMIGPEMRQSATPKPRHGSSKKTKKALGWVKASERFSWCVQRSTVRKFLQDNPCGMAAGKARGSGTDDSQPIPRWRTIVIVYNSGMGSGDAALRASWAPDLQYLLDLNIPCIFTCANDYMDVPGELELMQRQKAHFLLEPCRNPFAAMTTYRPEDNANEETQANAFVYVVKGRYDSAGAASVHKAAGCVSDVSVTVAAIEQLANGTLQQREPSCCLQTQPEGLKTSLKACGTLEHIDAIRQSNAKPVQSAPPPQECAAPDGCALRCQIPTVSEQHCVDLPVVSAIPTPTATSGCTVQRANAPCGVITVDGHGIRTYFIELGDGASAKEIRVCSCSNGVSLHVQAACVKWEFVGDGCDFRHASAFFAAARRRLKIVVPTVLADVEVRAQQLEDVCSSVRHGELAVSM